MMEPKPNSPLYITDLDGTLLQNDATLSPYAFKTLTRLLNEGLPFTVASARGAIAIKQILGDLPISLPVVAANGAYLSDFHTQRHLHIQALPLDLKAHIYEIIQKHKLTPVMATYEQEVESIYYTEVVNEGLTEFEKEKILKKDPRLKKVGNLNKYISEQVIHFTIIDQYAPLADLETELRETFPGLLEIHFYENVYNPGWYMFTILDHRATKSEAIQRMADLHGFNIDNLTVFGDNLNDIDMFQLAPNSVAVANAREELKSVSSLTIGPNHEDSVVKYLESL